LTKGGRKRGGGLSEHPNSINEKRGEEVRVISSGIGRRLGKRGVHLAHNNELGKVYRSWAEDSGKRVFKERCEVKRGQETRKGNVSL